MQFLHTTAKLNGHMDGFLDGGRNHNNSCWKPLLGWIDGDCVQRELEEEKDGIIIRDQPNNYG